MSLEEIANLIYEESAHHGSPLSLDIAGLIARKISPPRLDVSLVPGDIAKYHRERYEESDVFEVPGDDDLPP